ncbi:hypothetical protein ALMP_17420 [Streptomyces sp. A012304]|nr:hypothetical protein ALMP_17420 [Streptomyces sp. A012304]
MESEQVAVAVAGVPRGSADGTEGRHMILSLLALVISAVAVVFSALASKEADRAEAAARRAEGAKSGGTWHWPERT